MFEDREEAGIKLCPKLKTFLGRKNVVVVGLARGGVETAKPIAEFLNVKLNALVVKKIGAPGNQELAIGAMVSQKDVFWNKELLKELHIRSKTRESMVVEKNKELQELEKKLKIKKRKNDYTNKAVILVDDGVATGASAVASALYLKRNKAKEVILATPVIASDTLKNIKRYFDMMIFLEKKSSFYAVGEFYRNFDQVTDEKVARLLGNSI